MRLTGRQELGKLESPRDPRALLLYCVYRREVRMIQTSHVDYTDDRCEIHLKGSVPRPRAGVARGGCVNEWRVAPVSHSRAAASRSPRPSWRMAAGRTATRD